MDTKTNPATHVAQLSNEKLKIGLLLALAGISALLVFILLPAQPQPREYHQFADQKSMGGISNFWNVVTNIPFLIIGMLGYHAYGRTTSIYTLAALRRAYQVFFIGLIGVAFGSAFYHIEPTNFSLVWDRLPITVSMMALLAITIGDNISLTYGKKLLWPLVGLGIFSVIFWYISELIGAGDLRLYGIVQFLPMALIPAIFFLFRSQFIRRTLIWAALVSYLLAKMAEYFDKPIYEFSALLSGHSVKHLLAAIGTLCIFYSFKTPSADHHIHHD